MRLDRAGLARSERFAAVERNLDVPKAVEDRVVSAAIALQEARHRSEGGHVVTPAEKLGMVRRGDDCGPPQPPNARLPAKFRGLAAQYEALAEEYDAETPNVAARKRIDRARAKVLATLSAAGPAGILGGIQALAVATGGNRAATRAAILELTAETLIVRIAKREKGRGVCFSYQLALAGDEPADDEGNPALPAPPSAAPEHDGDTR